MSNESNGKSRLVGHGCNFHMRKNLSLIKLLWIIFLGLPLTTSASLYCPPSYALLSTDLKTMLVMCSSVPTNDDDGYIFTLPSGQQINLREKFKTNGVYQLDNFKCVQPLDWYSDEGELFYYGDFDILVRLNQFAVDTQNRTNWSWCLRFYNKGKVVRQYQVKDLVAVPNIFFLPETSSGWHTVWYELGAFTGGEGLYPLVGSYRSLWQFVLVTEPQFFGPIRLSDGNVFVFNVFTGDIIQQWRHHPLIKCLIVVVLYFALYFLALVFLVKISRKLFRKLWPKKGDEEMTKPTPFWIRRFIAAAFSAMLAIFGFFMLLILFINWDLPTSFDHFCSTVLLLAAWPFAASGFIWGDHHPVVAFLTGTLATGLFWAAFMELFFRLKDRRKTKISN